MWKKFVSVLERRMIFSIIYDRPRIIGDYHGQAPMLWCTYALLCK